MDTYTAIILVILVIVTEQFLVKFAKKIRNIDKFLCDDDGENKGTPYDEAKEVEV